MWAALRFASFRIWATKTNDIPIERLSKGRRSMEERGGEERSVEERGEEKPRGAMRRRAGLTKAWLKRNIRRSTGDVERAQMSSDS